LNPATRASLTVGPSGSAGPPPFVPNSAFARRTNTENRTNQQYPSSPAAATSLQWRSVTQNPTGLVIVNNVLKVSNNGTAGTQASAAAGSIRLSGITFPGSVPPRVLSVQPTPTVNTAALVGRIMGSRLTSPGHVLHGVLSGQPSPTTNAAVVTGQTATFGGTAPRAIRVNAATNSGTVSGNQFLDGGMGDIGLQWRDVTVNGSVRIEHNSCSIDVVADANNTGPITISGIRFDSGWSGSGAVTDSLFLTPTAASSQGVLRQATAASPAVITVGGTNSASNSATLTGGQFLDGGMGQIGLQWQQVTINCPIRIVNNVFSVTVSGTNTRDISIQNVTFGRRPETRSS
ncbi:MAG: hypothetical protein WCJ18_00955, partial [Planctomycetota bacterium]